MTNYFHSNAVFITYHMILVLSLNSRVLRYLINVKRIFDTGKSEFVTLGVFDVSTYKIGHLSYEEVVLNNLVMNIILVDKILSKFILINDQQRQDLSY